MILESTIIPFSAWLIEKAGSNGFDYLFNTKIVTEDIDKRFDKCFLSTCKQLQNKYPEACGGSIESLFRSSEVYEELLKLLFIDAKIDKNIISETIDLDTLPTGFYEEFIQTLKSKCSEDKELNKIFANKELYLTILGVGKNTNEIARFANLTHEEIKNIREILELRFNKQFSIEIFKQNYTRAALQTLSELNFIGLGVKSYIKKNRKKLKDVYVKPKFKLLEEQIEAQVFDEDENSKLGSKKNFPLINLFDFNSNLVILGNPGSGKSILVKFLICSILENRDSVLANKELIERIPFRIELRKYVQFKKETKGGLLKYLAQTFETEYGLYSLTDENVQRILAESKTLMFFDGLDEIFNINDKLDVKNDIENLSDSFPNLISIVTSRIIGYEEARLDKEAFIEVVILDFDRSQIEEYTKKWYAQEEKDDQIREKEVSDFLELSGKIDNELLRNPLLLSLIIILYRNNLKLPESKLEIYQSCTKTLVDKWDSTKELKTELSDDLVKWKETLFADLAFWQYERLSSSNVTITNEQATNIVTESILKKLKLTDDWIVAKNYAEQFMNYALKRSLYFDNNFTHKTFLEYFTAYWIFSNIEKKHKIDLRNEIVSKYIDNPFWSIVLELLINMIDQDQADYEIIDSLFKEQLDRKIEGLPFLLSILSSIKYKSSEVIKILLESALNLLITSKKNTLEYASLEQKTYQTIRGFLLIQSNVSVFKNVYNEFASNGFLNKEAKKNLVILYLELCMDFRGNLLDFDTLIIPDKIDYSNLLATDPYIYLLNRNATNGFNKKTPFEDAQFIIKTFGESAFLKEFGGKYEHFYFYSQFIIFLNWQLNENNAKNFVENINHLFSIGLSRIRVFELLKNPKENVFFNINEPNIEEVDKILKTNNDEFIKAVIILVLRKGAEDGFSSVELRKAIKESKSEGLNKYLSIKKFQSMVDKLIEDHNLEMFTSREKIQD
jgi:hypothetical protein